MVKKKSKTRKEESFHFKILLKVLYSILFLLIVIAVIILTFFWNKKEIKEIKEIKEQKVENIQIPFGVFFEKKEEEKPKKKKNEKYDLVYTWVNGQDPQFQKDYQEFVSKKNENAPVWGQYLCEKDLMYSLYSVQYHLHDFHRVYIIVHDGHELPSTIFAKEWKKLTLEFRNKIIFIPHSVIIPSFYLPTFNSIVIESFVHEIPDLSEYYVYINDDMILLRVYHFHDFFDDKGKPIESRENVPLVSSWVGGHEDKKNMDCLPTTTKPKMYNFNDMMLWNNELISRVFPQNETYHYGSQHVPSAFRKSWRKDMERFFQENLPTIYEATLVSKTRQIHNLAVNSLWKRYWHIYQYNCTSRHFNVNMITISHLQPSFQQSYQLLLQSKSSISSSPIPTKTVLHHKRTLTPTPTRIPTPTPTRIPTPTVMKIMEEMKQRKGEEVEDVLVIQNNIDGRNESIKGLIGFAYLERVLDILFFKE